MLFCSPEYNRGIPGVLKNAIDIGSRPYGRSVFDKKPAAIVTASPGSIGGFGANHQIRQAAVFLNMPVMQQPEAYLGHVSDDSFDDSGCLKTITTPLGLGMSDHFAELRVCLKPVVEAARWSCLPTARLILCESCIPK